MRQCCSREDVRGFTLVELLVTISILALLISILLPALSGARDSTRATVSLSDLRQLMIGYTVYQNDHQGSIMLGKPPSSLLNLNKITNSEGVPVHISAGDSQVAQRYPWRLMPYVNYEQQLLYSHESLQGVSEYAFSNNPSYGLNSTYVGGHEGPFTLGFIGGKPNKGAHVVFHQDEVKQASELIVLAEGVIRPELFGLDPNTGFFWSKPPVFPTGTVSWSVVNNTVQATTFPPGAVPIGRNVDAAAVSFFDGRASLEKASKLEDMRLWRN